MNANVICRYKVTAHVVRDLKEIESDWLSLQEVSECSYFQSWGWISVWVANLALDLLPIIIRVWHDDELVSLGIFVERKISRRLIIKSRSLFLNEYPFDGRNMVIEYNGLLVRDGHEEAAYSATTRYLLCAENKIDEIHYGAIQRTAPIEEMVNNLKNEAHLLCEETSRTWQVNLALLGDDLDSFFGSLSKNRRGQLKRSLRLYLESGPIEISEAQNAEEALEYLDDLKVLHTTRWNVKGKRGVFANPKWERFHRFLINERYQYGEIQLLRVGNSEEVIGYLYNYLWRGRVYVLQTGFQATKDKRLMPGYIVHSHAIIYNKQKGMKTYDFLHGDDVYKRILCNNQDKLFWMVMQKRKIKFKIENIVVSIVRKLRAVSEG